MPEPKLHLGKMLFYTNVYVEGDDTGGDFVQEIEQNRHGTSMSDRVAEWLGGLREEYLSRHLPDPLCWIEVNQDGTWRNISEETLETDIVLGISYIQSNLSIESPQLAELAMMESACGFLVAHADGNTETAYRFLSDFVQMHTLFWAEECARDDVLRGQKIKANAAEGGHAKARVYATRNNQILSDMQLLVDKGFSIERAGHLVAQKGCGASGKANKALWYRTRRKS